MADFRCAARHPHGDRGARRYHWDGGSGVGRLYATAVSGAIPIFDWAYFAVPVAVACVLACSTAERAVVTGLLVAVSVAAVNALGWSIYSAPESGLTTTALLGGFGVLLGLTPPSRPRDSRVPDHRSSEKPLPEAPEA